MTVIGKMLTFLILVLSLGWFYLTANAYVARVNWRAEAKRYQEEATKMHDAAEKANAVILAGRDAATDDRKALLAERDRQAATIKILTDSQKDLGALYAAAFTDAQNKSADAAKLQANIDQLLLEKKNADEKLAKNLADLNEYTLRTNRAIADQSKAELETKALRAQNESQREQIARLQQQLEDVRQGRTGGTGSQPAPQGFRATVKTFDPNRLFTEINQGLDSGVARGMVLGVSRIENGGGTYLGTLTLISLDAKTAVGRFAPAPGQARNPNSYPRPGDLVAPN